MCQTKVYPILTFPYWGKRDATSERIIDLILPESLSTELCDKQSVGRLKNSLIFVLSAGNFMTISNILGCSSVHSGSGSTVNFHNLIMNRQSLTGRNVERFYSRKNQKVFFHLVNYGWVFTKAGRELGKITIPLPWFLHLSIRNMLNIHG